MEMEGRRDELPRKLQDTPQQRRKTKEKEKEIAAAGSPVTTV